MPISQERMRAVIDAALAWEYYVDEVLKFVEKLEDNPGPNDAYTIRSYMRENMVDKYYIHIVAGEDKQFNTSAMKANLAARLKQQRHRANAKHTQQEILHELVEGAKHEMALEEYEKAKAAGAAPQSFPLPENHPTTPTLLISPETLARQAALNAKSDPKVLAFSAGGDDDL